MQAVARRELAPAGREQPGTRVWTQVAVPTSNH